MHGTLKIEGSIPIVAGYTGVVFCYWHPKLRFYLDEPESPHFSGGMNGSPYFKISAIIKVTPKILA